MSELQVGTVSDSVGWRSALAVIGRHDFVHTYDFHRASEAIGEGRPLAFVVHQKERIVGFWPLLCREIPDSDRHDLASVYGYGGPLFADGADTTAAINMMFDAMAESGAVSLFSRMHPLFINQIEDEGLRGERLSDVVVIPVSPRDEPPRGYRGSHRREIVNGIAEGLEVIDGNDVKALTQFKEIYDATMLAIGAQDYYFFNNEYYKNLLESQDFNIELLRAQFGGQCISAALFVQTGDIVQYYLSGTLSVHRKLAPSKALIAEAHRRAASRGVRSLILGGGVGSARDALFNFKAGFSDLHLPFHVTRAVLDPAAYNELCSQRRIDPATTSFFPAYRN